MSKHTPGKWVAREVNGMGWPGQRGFAIDFNEDQEQVVDFVYEEADAHLIAAAPDLLEALEALQLYVENNLCNDYPTGIDVNSVQFQAASAAIARARGES